MTASRARHGSVPAQAERRDRRRASPFSALRPPGPCVALWLVVSGGAAGCCFGTPTPMPTAAPPVTATAPMPPPPAPVPATAPTPLALVPEASAPAVNEDLLAWDKVADIQSSCLAIYSREHLDRARSGYVDRMGEGERPSHTEWSNPSSLNWLHFQSVRGCRTSIERASTLRPEAAELDLRARVYLVALETLVRTGQDVRFYYERESWRDDGGERGRTLHGEMLLAFESFEPADRELRVEVRRLEQRTVIARAALLENDPAQRAAYLTEDAQRWLGEASLEVARIHPMRDGSRVRLGCPDPDALWNAVTHAQTAIDALRSPDVTGVDGTYVNDANALLVELLRIARAVREDTHYRSAGAAYGALIPAQRAYDVLLTDYHGLHR